MQSVSSQDSTVYFLNIYWHCGIIKYAENLAQTS